jgi:type I restriction enzyme, S subunit
MIEGLKPYAEYKESGLPWLEQVPCHWRICRNGNLFAQRNQTGYAELPILEVSLKTGVRVRDFANSSRKQIMSDLTKYKRAVKGDAAYNMMRMWQGAVRVSPVDGLVSPAYVVLRPYPGVDSRFYALLYRTGVYMSEIDNCSHGIVKDRNRLYWDQFKQMQSLSPPPDEQAAIVRFLDHANRKIDRFIRAKRKLIALLGEQKQAIIHQAVTRGLKPNVPLKSSGILWLGDIPGHWEVLRLKHLVRLNPSKSEIPFMLDNEFVTFLPMERVSAQGEIDRSETIRIGNATAGFTYMRNGDVIVAKITPCFENGKGALCVGLKGGFGFGSTEFHVLRPCEKIVGEFLYLLTRDPIVRQMGAESMQGSAGQQRVPRDYFANLRVPFPPLAEQAEIVSHVNNELGKFNLTIIHTEREIALMREYRTRLTADIVTGKLDVREAAANIGVNVGAKNFSPLPADADTRDEELLEEPESGEE